MYCFLPFVISLDNDFLMQHTLNISVKNKTVFQYIDLYNYLQKLYEKYCLIFFVQSS